MYIGLLHTHSLLRYFVVLMLLITVIGSLLKWASNKPYGRLDDKASLYLLIFTHLQLLAGLFLYMVSPFVQFNSNTMSEKTTRYWTVEHITLMLLAIALITVARIRTKNAPDARSKHLRTWMLNGIALLIILVSIKMSGRGIIHPDLF